MAFVIKDIITNEYYRQRLGSKGWYSSDINDSRLYTAAKQAQKTINDAEHHVTYPGNRTLKVIEVFITEV